MDYVAAEDEPLWWQTCSSLKAEAQSDRPGEGLINVSQQMMIDLRDSLADAKP
jgi:hypothetical protein